ncbi:amidohydrolase family protein [Leucobacter sp. CSA1]|uniref:Amidohydrolase family protein n=2 Tax=Leucobacter chromiisoli TaxID=2796471 RepID=A0A934Q729_9MICO|nr:amidohydrolase family protein [Leucobacter chromiisoli]
MVDAHLHAGWHAFDAVDRNRETPEQRAALIAETLRRTLHAGITSVRDAGGLREREAFEGPTGAAARQPTERSAGWGGLREREAFEGPTGAAARQPTAPRLQTSVVLIDRAEADRSGGAVAAADRALAEGARWVKLMATAGVAAPAGTPLDPVFTRAEQRAVVERAAETGAAVMVHAWGGGAIDDAIEAGAASIEHGIYLTEEQASRAAERGMTLVPTLRIYRLVQGMIARGELPTAFRTRVDEAVAAHPRAVLRARDAGLAIALGTDYGTRDQHGTNRSEFDELVRAGLSPSEALVAATRAGAELLRRAAPAGRRAELPSGAIAHGEVADAVVLRRDPREPGALSAPDAVVAVVLGGRVIDVAGSAPGSPPGSRPGLDPGPDRHPDPDPNPLDHHPAREDHP